MLQFVNSYFFLSNTDEILIFRLYVSQISVVLEKQCKIYYLNRWLVG